MTLILGPKTIKASWSPEAREKIRRYEKACKREERAAKNVELAKKWMS